MNVTTRGRRWREGLWLLPLLLAVAGCGPGVGGTGTGDGFAFDLFGARAASVCTASFARELKCPSRIVIGPSSAPPSEGSETVLWVDDPGNASVTARISASNVEFIAVCDGVRFEGAWGEIPGQAGRFFGYFTVPGIAAALPGSLTVAADAESLSLVLSDADGKRLLGPVPMQRSESAPTMATCPVGSASPQLGSTFR
jgi:hypothetical protein